MGTRPRRQSPGDVRRTRCEEAQASDRPEDEAKDTSEAGPTIEEGKKARELAPAAPGPSPPHPEEGPLGFR